MTSLRRERRCGRDTSDTARTGDMTRFDDRCCFDPGEFARTDARSAFRAVEQNEGLATGSYTSRALRSEASMTAAAAADRSRRA
jgi:hypothetical protein